MNATCMKHYDNVLISSACNYLSVMNLEWKILQLFATWTDCCSITSFTWIKLSLVEVDAFSPWLYNSCCILWVLHLYCQQIATKLHNYLQCINNKVQKLSNYSFGPHMKALYLLWLLWFWLYISLYILGCLACFCNCFQLLWMHHTMLVHSHCTCTFLDG